jgi:hypothetical protein
VACTPPSPLVRCDRCGCALAAGSLKYTVRIAVTADFDGHLVPEGEQEGSLNGVVESAAALSQEVLEAGVHQELAFLVCPSCRGALLRDPLAAGFLRQSGGMVQ